jgi:membrane-associated protein
MSAWIHHQANWLIAHNLQLPLFILLTLFIFAEAAAFVGFVLPGETSLLIGGVLAHGKVWPLWLFLLVSVIAAITGDTVGYEVGKHFGPRIKTNRFGRLIGEKRWNLAQHVFDKYGGWAIFFGRAQALLRALVPALAGLNKVPYKVFLRWNAAGGIVFCALVVILGYEFASKLDTLEKALKYWAFGFLAIVFVLIVLIKRKLEEKLEV